MDLDDKVMVDACMVRGMRMKRGPEREVIVCLPEVVPDGTKMRYQISKYAFKLL